MRLESLAPTYVMNSERRDEQRRLGSLAPPDEMKSEMRLGSLALP